ALDPKPYIRTLEASLDALARISNGLGTREQKIQSEVSHVELEHQQNTALIERECQTLLDQFAKLDILVSEASSTTTTLGESADLVSRQRNRAASSSFLIKCYLSFLQDDTSVVDNLRQGSLENQRQGAVIVRQLLRIAKKITSIKDSARARQNIEKYAEALERDLLKMFDRAYRSADMDQMKATADILTEFNGGSSVIQIFVNQHDFFIMKEKLLHEAMLDDNNLWQTLSDPDCERPPFDASTTTLLDEIESTVKKESEIITRVFSHPENVLKIFLQRIFAQSVQQRLELVISHAETVSHLCYLRTVQLAHYHLTRLVTTLKKHLAPNLDSRGTLSMLLDSNMQDIFVPYVENGKYIESEKKNLEELTGGLFYRFHQFHVRQRSGVADLQSFQKPVSKTHNNRIFDRFGTQIPHGQEPTGRMQQFMRLARIDRAPSMKTKKLSGTDHDIQYDDGDELLNIEDTKRVVKWFIEATVRVQELGTKVEIPKFCSDILELLIECLGRSYVEVALDYAIERSAFDHRVDPDLSFMLIIGTATQIINLINTTVTAITNDLATRSYSMTREMTSSVHNFVNRMEEKINIIENNAVEGVLSRCIFILGRKKREYLSSAEDDSVPTQTAKCQEILALIMKIYELSAESLSGINLEVFVAELGCGLRDVTSANDAVRHRLKKALRVPQLKALI
ncbi:exocyst complex component Sec10-like protein, partial [Dipodascopsis tothii]|uniref:exocyst complex component Sec10-like protein n=1 Tax=Dipodascopsis tothii TaxID=44089 RepID=UPI0034D017CD